MSQVLRSVRITDGPGEMAIVFAIHHGQDANSDSRGHPQPYHEAGTLRFAVEYDLGHSVPEFRRMFKTPFRVGVVGAIRLSDEEVEHALLLVGKGEQVSFPGNPGESRLDNSSKWVAINYDAHRRTGILWCLPESPFKHPVIQAMCRGRLDALDVIPKTG